MPLRRYACPHCRGALSRTTVHPKWLNLEAETPEFRFPLLQVVATLVAIGLGLTLLHPALGLLGVVLVVAWLYWRYFSWLQCDACQRFYFGGQLSGGPRHTVPWTPRDIQRVVYRTLTAAGVLLAVFLPLRYIELKTRSNCHAECSASGMAAQATFNKCTCVPRGR